MKTRFNGYARSTEDYLREILVECTNCSQKAVVTVTSLKERKEIEEIKFSCTNCGIDKVLLEKAGRQINFGNSEEWERSHFYMQTNIDPYFGLPLWLQKEFPEGLLWAYNFDHLSFLEHQIAAELRERKLDGILDCSIESRLPKWMSTDKKAEEILLTIQQLKKK